MLAAARVELARVATGARASGSGSERIRPRGSPGAPRARPAPPRASGRSPAPKRKSRSFIILPADGFEGREGDGGWSLWQASEAGSVLVGTRRARRKRQQMSDHWRKIMAMAGVEGAEPEDVARRIAVALEAVEREHERYAAELHELERGNRGADVCAAEVKRLKVRKLRAKDDAARLRRAAAAAAEARSLGEGSFGKVFLGRDADTLADVAVKVEDARAVPRDECAVSFDDQDENTHAHESDPGSNPASGTCVRVSPLELERDAMTLVARVSGPAGFPRVHFFGEQSVFGRPSRVLVMDLLGPSLEDMSWAVSAGGPLSAPTALMIADQALARVAAVHRAGIVHRDVKPDNLLLGNPDKPGGARTIHLVDFGLAARGPAAGAAGVAGVASASASPSPSPSPSPSAVSRDETRPSPSPSSLQGTPRYSSAAADAGRPPTYSDDLEALVFSLSYLRAGTTPWVRAEDRGDFEATTRAKANATGADLADDPEDAAWLGALLTHARETPFGSKIDLGWCRGVVRRAFADATGGKRMRETPFDWEEAGVVAVSQRR